MAVLCLLAAASAAVCEPLEGTGWRPVTARVRAAPSPPEKPPLKAPSTFTFAGAIRIRFDDQHLGAWTGFDVGDDGQFLAVTDAGYLVRGQIELGDRAVLTGLSGLGVERALDAQGKPVPPSRQPDGVALTAHSARVFLASPATILTYADAAAPATASLRVLESNAPRWTGQPGVAMSHSAETDNSIVASATGRIIGCSNEIPSTCDRQAREQPRFGPLVALRQFAGELVSLHDAPGDGFSPAWTIARRKTPTSCDICVGTFDYWLPSRALLRIPGWARDFTPTDMAMTEAPGQNDRVRFYVVARQRDDPRALLLIALDWDFLSAQPDDRDEDVSISGETP